MCNACGAGTDGSCCRASVESMASWTKGIESAPLTPCHDVWCGLIGCPE